MDMYRKSETRFLSDFFYPSFTKMVVRSMHASTNRFGTMHPDALVFKPQISRAPQGWIIQMQMRLVEELEMSARGKALATIGWD